MGRIALPATGAAVAQLVERLAVTVRRTLCTADTRSPQVRVLAAAWTGRSFSRCSAIEALPEKYPVTKLFDPAIRGWA